MNKNLQFQQKSFSKSKDGSYQKKKFSIITLLAFALFIFSITPIQAQFVVSGPSTLCPNTNGTFTKSGSVILNCPYTIYWKLRQNGVVIVNTDPSDSFGTGYSTINNSFTVKFPNAIDNFVVEVHAKTNVASPGCGSAYAGTLKVKTAIPAVSPIDGPNSVCSSGTYNYSIQPISNCTSQLFFETSAPLGWTINQSGSNFAVNIPSGTQEGIYQIKIRANEPSYGPSDWSIKSITVGPPPTPIIFNTDSGPYCYGDVIALSVMNAQQGTQYTWYSSYGVLTQGSEPSNPSHATLLLTGNNIPSQVYIEVTPSNICGDGYSEFFYIDIDEYCNYMFTTTSNPVENEIVVNLENTDTEKEVVLVSDKGKILQTKKTRGNLVKFDVSTLNNGVYYLKRNTSKKAETKRIIIIMH